MLDEGWYLTVPNSSYPERDPIVVRHDDLLLAQQAICCNNFQKLKIKKKKQTNSLFPRNKISTQLILKLNYFVC